MLPAVQILKSFTPLSNKKDYFLIPCLVTGLEVHLKICLLLFLTYQLLIVQRKTFSKILVSGIRYIDARHFLSLLISQSPVLFHIPPPVQEQVLRGPT